jgi:hypothetical protein
LLYLNRCVGGCAVQSGPDNAINNTSTLVIGTRIIPAFAYGDASWNALTRCVRRVYAPYFIEITEIDPGNVPHRELMIGGLPADIGMSGGPTGVAPWACGAPINNAIGFVFADAILDDTAELCWNATHEGGHLFGLDHELYQPDSMSYAPIVDHFKHFTDVDAPCGEDTSRPCYCGSPTSEQNSDARLAAEQGRDRLFADGMGEDPWELPPDALFPRVMGASLSCGTRTDRDLPMPAGE